MCGIAGILSDRRPEPPRIDAALRAMQARGPDASGVWRGTVAGRQAMLLHTRLAIVDLDPRANQPFEAFDCVLVYNGEIYNYRELRAELVALGCVFKTQSDTEVAVAAYRYWGQAAFARFEGMWALALYDRQSDELLLGRDSFGEKPLFYLDRDGEFVFASDVRTIARLARNPLVPDAKQLRRYLVNGYRSLGKTDATWYEGLREVPVGSVMRLTRDGIAAPQHYWQLRVVPQPMSLTEAEEGVRTRVLKALDLRLRADVPIAFCLSGGIDSTVLACLAAKHFDYPVHAFSIVDADPRYDESASIETTVRALECKHTLVRTGQTGFLDRLAAQIRHRACPVATISYHLHEYLSESIAGEGFKVAVSGTAADEILTGYYDYYGFWLAAMADRPNFPELVAQWRAGYGASVRNPVLKDPLAFAKNPAERGHIYLDRDLFQSMMRVPLDEDFSEKRYCADDLRNRMMNDLFEEIVPVILREDDLNSMRYSVENRSPFLDRDLVSFAYSVPIEHLVQDGMPKWLLRAAGRGVAPPEILFDRRKRGFNASIDSLLDRRDPAVRERLLAPSPIFETVDRAAFEGWMDSDLSDNSVSKFMFSFVSAKLFLETADEIAAVPAA